MPRILVLNGPNLNLLGSREPSHYGQMTLDEIGDQLQQLATEQGAELMFFQSNAEHELIARIQQAPIEQIDFLIFNPAAFTHTSVALRDAILAVGLPFIELHLSNVHARESFRAHSYFSDIASGVILGFGPLGYRLALTAALASLADNKEQN